jgi:hypothetical protein
MFRSRDFAESGRLDERDGVSNVGTHPEWLSEGFDGDVGQRRGA